MILTPHELETKHVLRKSHPKEEVLTVKSHRSKTLDYIKPTKFAY